MSAKQEHSERAVKLSSVLLFVRIALVIASSVAVLAGKIDWATLAIAWAAYLKVIDNG